MLKLQYGLGKKYNYEMKYDSLLFEEKEFVFEMNTDDLVITGAEIDKAALIELLRTEMNTVKNDILEAKEEYVARFPMDVIIPFTLIFYATQFAESLTV